jgi:cation transport regulator
MIFNYLLQLLIMRSAFIKKLNSFFKQNYKLMNETKEILKSTDDIPGNLKEILPPHAQHIYMKSHNRAIKQYENPKSRKYGGSLEEVAHRVAWSAVKSKYKKNEKTGFWEPLPGVNQDNYEEEYEEDPDA